MNRRARIATKICTLPALLFASVCSAADPSPQPLVQSVTVFNEGIVANDGLWLTRRMFGRNLAVHGDCLAVHKGYIFLAWWQGGMDNRTAHLSRKKIGEGEWKTISFPHRHVMFRGDKNLPEAERRGDTHNTIAVGISPKDDTIHLLYDMHAYTPADFPNDYFNYSGSKKGAAVVPDEQWSVDLFHPKRNYLSEEAVKKNPKAYYAVTYPNYNVTADGNLIAMYRYGGTTNATMSFSKYDGESWSEPWIWNKQPEKRFGIYGGLSVYGNKAYYRWTHKLNDIDPNTKKNVFDGPFMAYCPDINVVGGPWYSMDGKEYELPLKDLEQLRATGKWQQGAFIESPTGEIINVIRTPENEPPEIKGEKPFQPEGTFLVGNRVYAVGLVDTRPVVISTEANKNEWRVDLKMTEGPRFLDGQCVQVGKSIFYGLVDMNGPQPDARVIHMLRFDIKTEE